MIRAGKLYKQEWKAPSSAVPLPAPACQPDSVPVFFPSSADLVVGAAIPSAVASPFHAWQPSK